VSCVSAAGGSEFGNWVTASAIPRGSLSSGTAAAFVAAVDPPIDVFAGAADGRFACGAITSTTLPGRVAVAGALGVAEGIGSVTPRPLGNVVAGVTFV
jgi:hypothetical protein